MLFFFALIECKLIHWQVLFLSPLRQCDCDFGLGDVYAEFDSAVMESTQSTNAHPLFISC